jgi:transcriptional regulator with XRE-family HTH domain
MPTRSTFAARLKWWRERRGLSQLDLAHAAEVSQRHLSFLEIDRTTPSREMVLKLAAALDLSLRQQNELLLAAGFAPIWRESPLSAPELATVNRALDFMLEQHEPYAAFVVDRRWNLLRANRGGQRMVAFLTDTPPRAPDPANPINLADALVSPDGLRPLIVNWREVALYFLRGVREDALADGTDETAALVARLLAYEPVLSIHFRKADMDLKVFTTLATLGTPQDVTVQEIRIESFFPADTAAATVFKSWAATE